eukprot:m.223199 g.223199  ORF g.223199 m.223199 type:complete len:150 (+) comp39981_c1_seq2:2084-2533(+)
MPKVKRSTPVESTGDTSPTRKTAESTPHVTVVPYDLSDTSDDDEIMLSLSSPQATSQGSSSQERRPSSSSGTLYNDSEGEMGDNLNDGDGTETESRECTAQRRILDEIDRIHDELEDRLDFLEEQLQALEESGETLVSSVSECNTDNIN